MIQFSTFPGRGRTQANLQIMLAYANGRFNKEGFLDRRELDQIVNKHDPKTFPEASSSDYKFHQALAVMQLARKGTCFNIGCPATHDASYAKLCSQCKLTRFCGEKVGAHSPIFLFSRRDEVRLTVFSARKRRGDTNVSLTR